MTNPPPSDPNTEPASRAEPQADSTRAESVRAEVLGAILQVAPDLDHDDLEASADLHDELGLDSVDLLNITSALVERTGLEIPESELSSLHTVGDLIEFIADRSGSQS